MKKEQQGDEQQMLAAIIAEALHIADSLDLAIVGISLDAALQRLTGHGHAPVPVGASIH